MKIAIPDQSFRTVPGWEAHLPLIPALGVDHVDLCLHDGRTQLQFADLRDVPALAERVNVATRAAGVSVASVDVCPSMVEIPGHAGAGGQNMAVNHPDAEQRDAAWDIFLRGLELAERTGAELISVPAGAFFDEPREASFDRAVEAHARRHEEAARRGVRFVAETHVGSVFETIDECLRLGEEVPGLKIALDPTNYAYLGNTDAEILRLIPLAGHVHVRGGAKGMAQTRFEDSTIDYDLLVSALVDAGYDGFFRLECVWRDDEDYLADIDVVTELVHYRDLLRAHGAR
ncbi:sugar phosphate isomerase/epimerase family protein [Nocardioides sp. GY 10127]|uniref:sugar phosphate isomerase/epimerase family protein n=1 Tax=Nocardioides sp. GY 10127 TaxID=2569762 RepID=UPI0010A7ED84|nr:sugar phosphate isomerase/epimerase family protein [Nocardioides sp. GY 10127]TIC80029.1 sugar phosphate isomerase/epimerase [Nocardioides sp. GY 10127]